MPKQPTDAEVLRRAIDSALTDVYTGMPGIVQSYDVSKQVADIQPALKRVIKNRGESRVVEDLPIIQNVRVQWPAAGDFWVTLPLKAGDHVWLVFSWASDDKFRALGDVQEPDDLRRHSLGDAWCYPIPGPDKVQSPDASATDMVMGKHDGSGALVRIEDSGDVRVGRNATEKIARADRTDADIAALWALLRGTSTPPWVPVPNDGGLALKDAANNQSGLPAGTAADKGYVE